jgi:hypothetical protein
VSDALTALLPELEVFDRATTRPSRIGPRRMLNITRDTGEFLAALVKATNATRVPCWGSLGPVHIQNTAKLTTLPRATAPRVRLRPG